MAQRKTLLVLLFAIGNITMLLGAFMKVQHVAGAGSILTTGMVMALGFIVFALSEVYTSKRIERADKIMWTLLLLCSSGIAGIVYLASSRKQII